MLLIHKESHSTDSKILLCVSVDSIIVYPLHNQFLHNNNNTDDDNRIVLKSLPEATDCQGDYINACYIDVRRF